MMTMHCNRWRYFCNKGCFRKVERCKTDYIGSAMTSNVATALATAGNIRAANKGDTIAAATFVASGG
jgi:hypothetical protein